MKKRIDKLARKLWLAYVGPLPVVTFDQLTKAQQQGWRDVAKAAIAEVGKLPKPKRRKCSKACRIGPGGKRVCT